MAETRSGPDAPGAPAGQDGRGATQLDLLEEGRRRRDAGMKAAEHAAHPWVRSAIDRWIRDRETPFTTDDLRRDIEPLASSPNLVGAAVAVAARRGDIVMIDHVRSTRPEAHGRYIKLWAKPGEGA